MRNRNYNEELDEDLDDELDEDFDDYDDDDDEDEEESVAEKLKKLKGKIEGVALFFLIIGGIGLISIICSFFVGGGFGFGGKPVPDDIYGTYYGVVDYEYYTIYIDEEGSSSIVNRGFDDGEETVYIKTEYVEASKAQSKILNPNPEYDGYDAIFLYEDHDTMLVLWIVETEPEYKLVINSNGVELTTEPYNFKAEMGDYSNYYGKYTYDSNNSVEFFEDGTAEFKFNGNTTTYKYAFVNKAWHERWINKTIGTNGALLLYDEYNNTQTFEFISKSQISYGGQYTFTGTGSPDIDPNPAPAPEEPDDELGGGDLGGGDLGGGDIGGGDLGGGDLGGGDIGGGDLGGGDLGGGDIGGGDLGGGDISGDSGVTEETPDWATLLDFSNVSFSLELGEDSTYELLYDEINDRYWVIETFESVYGYTETYQYYYSPSFGGYYMDSYGDESYISKSDVLDECYVVYSYIDNIDASSLEKVGENVWENSSYKITLGSDGEVAKIECTTVFEDTLVFNIFDRGTTTIPAYCPF